MKIKLVSTIGVHCSSIDDGQEFFNQIYPEFKEGRSVEVDFKGIESILNSIFTQLHRQTFGLSWQGNGYGKVDFM